MATREGMSGIDLRAVVTEWKSLFPLWINKVYLFPPGHLVLRLHGREHARYFLLIENGKRAHLTADLPEAPKFPPPFAMLLRKHISGGRILSIRQYGIQRIVTIDIGKHETEYHLVIELFDEGNVVLCDQQYTIIQPMRPQRFRERDVVAGVPYVFPPPDPSTFSPEEFRQYLAQEDRDLVRALAVGVMLGGAYAEALCQRAGIDKTIPAHEADAGVLYRELHRLLTEAEEEIAPLIQPGACLPIGGEAPVAEEGIPAFNRALGQFYPPVPARESGIAKVSRARNREERIRARQAEILSQYEKKVARNERIVELMYEYYPVLQDILTTLEKASRTKSWQEISQILAAQDSGLATKIVSINPAVASVDVDIGERVTLYIHENLEASIGRYFDATKKLKKKIAGARTAMDRPVVVEKKKAVRTPIMKRRWFHRFRWFTTSDGVLVLGGKDASQNEELVKKYMEGGDRFVHADVHGASVVIVKGSTGRMDEVAQFAASYSGAWRSGHFAADVYAVSPSQVSKTPESGEYISRGSFVVRGEREYYRDVPLAVAIGLQREPEVSVIGGPPSAVSAKTDLFVPLKPGTFEPNDIARKLLRVLRERLGADEAKGLKGVLSAEAIAAFVPPGGSDMVVEP
jgi:predicted ribosome quality control (RQC) complex YloA/Tae2 family protein